MFCGRDSSRSTWRCESCSSAASSIVTTRSDSGMAEERALSRVVLPVPVPPEMTTLRRASTHAARNSTAALRERAEADHLVEVEPLGLELADRDERPRQRQRRDDHVDAAAVGEPRVDHRRRLVDAPADLGDHLVDDAPQVGVVGEPDGGVVQAALPLDPDLVGAVDHDLGDRVVGQQPLDRAVAEDVGRDLLRQRVALVAGQPDLACQVTADVGRHELAEVVRGRRTG